VEIEKIEIKGHPKETDRWVEAFYLMYIDSTGSLVPYKNKHNVSGVNNI
jgi:hypothetical protein